MKIAKALNNSCVIILDDNGKEMVLLGNGLGFGKKPGDEVDKSKIDKVFVLESQTSVNRFAELLQRVPEQVVALAEDLIEMARDEFGMTLDESIHISLPDHIDGAIRNYEAGVSLHNVLLLEIRKFYQQEFTLGERALGMIQKQLQISLGEDEAGFIAMHFVSAQSRKEHDQTKEIILLVNEIDKIINKEFSKELAQIDKESLIYCRYMTHLKFFAQRVLTKTYFPETGDEKLGRTVQKYFREYQCSEKVCQYVKENYNYRICEEELMYLTIHLVQILHTK